MIDFVCDGCHAALQIDDEWAGKLGHCPHCGTDTRVPGNSKRTSKLTIVFRMAIIPFLVVAFWGLMLSIADTSLGLYLVLGGLIALVLGIGFLWAFTNFFTFLLCPREYRIWKKGGGDPFFDTLDTVFNPDPPSTRYQELFREKARMECEQLGIPLQSPSPPPDLTLDLDDPNII